MGKFLENDKPGRLLCNDCEKKKKRPDKSEYMGILRVWSSPPGPREDIENHVYQKSKMCTLKQPWGAFVSKVTGSRRILRLKQVTSTHFDVLKRDNIGLKCWYLILS